MRTRSRASLTSSWESVRAVVKGDDAASCRTLGGRLRHGVTKKDDFTACPTFLALRVRKVGTSVAGLDAGLGPRGVVVRLGLWVTGGPL